VPPAWCGSILVPNAGVEAYRDWVVYLTGRDSLVRVGTDPVRITGSIITAGYGVSGRVMLYADAELQNMRIGSQTRTVHSGTGAIRAKWNFWSRLGPGSYHRLALIAGLGLPFGKPGDFVSAPSPSGPAAQLLPARVTPSLNLLYSRSVGRWVYGVGVGYSEGTERKDTRPGHQVSGMSDLEYLLKRWENNEISLIFGATAQRLGRAKWEGATLEQTGGSQAITSYGIQFAARSTFAAEAAFRTSVWQNLRPGQPGTDTEVVFGIRWLH
jgi:hypothetical protein